MTLLPFFEWIQDTAIGTSIRESIFVFPIVETIHVIGLALSVGLILITDLRLTGIVMAGERPVDIIRPLKVLMITGFVLMFSSGALLFWAEAAKCYKSPAFRFKMIFLLLAGLNALYFESTLGRNTAAWSAATVLPSRARLAGWLSLICWIAVISFGRWTAYGLK
jgi:hypothetical protein